MELKSKKSDGAEIKIDVRANNLARLFYLQEFKAELDDALNAILSHEAKSIFGVLSSKINLNQMAKIQGLLASKEQADHGKAWALIAEAGVRVEDLLAAQNGKIPKVKYPSFEASKIIWAMAKAYAFTNGKQQSFQSFDKWLIDFADFDVNDCADDFLTEVMDGFFRSKTGAEK